MIARDIIFTADLCGGESIELTIERTTYAFTFSGPPRRCTLAKSLEGLCDKINDRDHLYKTGFRAATNIDGITIWDRLSSEPFYVNITSPSEHLTFEVKESFTNVEIAA